jgi:hypothetical protein
MRSTSLDSYHIRLLAMACILIAPFGQCVATETTPSVALENSNTTDGQNPKQLARGQRVTSKLSSAESENWYSFTQRNGKQSTLNSKVNCNKAPRTAFDTYGYNLTWYSSDGTQLGSFPFSTSQCRGLTYRLKLPTPQAGVYLLSISPPSSESGLTFTNTPYSLQIGTKPVVTPVPPPVPPVPTPPPVKHVYPPGTINATCIDTGIETFPPYIASYGPTGLPFWQTDEKPPLTYAGITMQTGTPGQKLIPLPVTQNSVGNEIKPVCREWPSYSGCQPKPHVVTAWYCFYDLSLCDAALSGTNGCVLKK